MFKRFLVLAIFFFSMGKIMSQTPEDSVKLTINQFMNAIGNSNGISIIACFADSNSTYQTIFKNRNGGLEVKNENIREFAHIIGSQPLNSISQKFSFDVVKTDGPLAAVWTSYKFYANGKVHHCGICSFQLVRLGNQWKIQYLIDTRHTDRCE